MDAVELFQVTGGGPTAAGGGGKAAKAAGAGLGPLFGALVSALAEAPADATGGAGKGGRSGSLPVPGAPEQAEALAALRRSLTTLEDQTVGDKTRQALQALAALLGQDGNGGTDGLPIGRIGTDGAGQASGLIDGTGRLSPALMHMLGGVVTEAEALEKSLDAVAAELADVGVPDAVAGAATAGKTSGRAVSTGSAEPTATEAVLAENAAALAPGGPPPTTDTAHIGPDQPTSATAMHGLDAAWSSESGTNPPGSPAGAGLGEVPGKPPKAPSAGTATDAETPPSAGGRTGTAADDDAETDTIGLGLSLADGSEETATGLTVAVTGTTASTGADAAAARSGGSLAPAPVRADAVQQPSSSAGGAGSGAAGAGNQNGQDGLDDFNGRQGQFGQSGEGPGQRSFADGLASLNNRNSAGPGTPPGAPPSPGNWATPGATGSPGPSGGSTGAGSTGPAAAALASAQASGGFAGQAGGDGTGTGGAGGDGSADAFYRIFARGFGGEDGADGQGQSGLFGQALLVEGQGKPAAAAFAALRGGRPSARSVPDQVSVQLRRGLQQGMDRLTIMLEPRELGRIDIRLEIGADRQVRAHIAADKSQTLELLQKDARGLERLLQDAGFKTDGDSLSFSLKNQNQPGNGGLSDGRSRGGNEGQGLDGGTDADDGTADGGLTTMVLTADRIDVRI